MFRRSGYVLRCVQLFVLVLVVCAVTSRAQTTEFTFQGRLQDGGGSANGSYDFQFTLWDSLSGGTQQPQPSPVTVTKTNVAVSSGIFTVQLDFGASAFPGADRFLETSVRLAGGGVFTVLSPRQPITSTPYSLRSLSTTTADALSSACVNCITSAQIQGVQGSQVSSPIPVADVPAGSANYIQNGATAQAASNFNISGDGTAGGTLSGNIVNAATQFNLGGSRAFAVTGVAPFPTGNTFAGVDSGTANSPQDGGVLNTFFGGGSGRLNSSGAENTFFGTLTGRSNTTGAGNSYFGDFAGASNTSAANGSFFGSGAGFSNTTGSQNSFFGQQSGNSNDGGFNNSFFGSHSGQASVSGSNNSFFGVLAGFANVSGSNNTIVGAKADLGGNGLTNATAIGANTIVSQSNSLILGNNANVGIGTTSPTANLTVAQSTSGVGLVAIVAASAAVSGTNTQFNNTFRLGDTITVSGQTRTITFIASDISLNVDAPFSVTASNLTYTLAGGTRMVVKGHGNVGIGTATPTSRLHVIGDTNLVGNLTVSGTLTAQLPGGNTNYIQNTTSPQGSSNFNISGNGVIGGSVGIGTTSPAVALEVRRNSSIASDWQTGQLRISGASDPNMQLSLGYDTSNNLGVIQAGQAFTGFKTLSLNPFGGNVGIGTSIPVSKLDLVNPSGDGFVRLNFVSPGAVAVCHNGSLQLSSCSSSLRYKTNVMNFRFGLEVINQLRPITFDWKEGGMHDLGLGAEDVEKIEPLLVTYNREGQVEGVKYERIGVVLINAVKEQQAQIEKQQEQLTRQQEQITQQHRQAKQQRAAFAAQQQQIEALKKLVCRTHRRASLCR